mmetsp:Transcript_721/g.2535  ORF Transcript_721/g.2535 Transcript_721/m.2535 type:complete len:113 (+) Transcript_721:2584-2922(+)
MRSECSPHVQLLRLIQSQVPSPFMPSLQPPPSHSHDEQLVPKCPGEHFEHPAPPNPAAQHSSEASVRFAKGHTDVVAEFAATVSVGARHLEVVAHHTQGPAVQVPQSEKASQ